MLGSRRPEALLKGEQRRQLGLGQPGLPDEYLSQLLLAFPLFRQGLVELRTRDASGLDQ